MNQRHFLIYSGIACSAIAIGSVGPWASGFLGYSGISGYGGILVLLGAGLAVLALWRWTISRRRGMLIAAQVIGSLCIVVAAYAIYHVIYDTYAHVDSGLRHIGWGVILTLAGAAALTMLSVFRYRQDRLAEGIPLGWPKIVLLASLVAAVAMAPLAVSAVSSDNPTYEWDLFAGDPASPIPPFALKMVGQKVLNLSQGASLGDVMTHLGEPLSETTSGSETTLYYLPWQLHFQEGELRQRVRETRNGRISLSESALDRKVIFRLVPGMTVREVRERLGTPEVYEQFYESARRPAVILRYAYWELYFPKGRLVRRTSN